MSSGRMAGRPRPRPASTWLAAAEIVDAPAAPAALEAEKAVDALAGSLLQSIQQASAETRGRRPELTWAGDLLQSRRLIREGNRLEWQSNSKLGLRDLFKFDAEAFYQSLLEKAQSE